MTLDIAGPAAPPRANGELVFAEPWESRAFGLAVTLHAGGAFEWEAFRQELMAAVARSEAAQREAAQREAEAWSYYTCWLEALERVLVAEGMVAAGDIADRVGQLAGRPSDHNHRHDDHQH